MKSERLGNRLEDARAIRGVRAALLHDHEEQLPVVGREVGRGPLCPSFFAF